MSPRHIHKYIRHKFHKSGTVVFRCVLSNCSHYLAPAFVLGKMSLCWYCDNVFEMSKRSVRLKKPHCGCKGKRPGKHDDHIMKLVEGLFK